MNMAMNASKQFWEMNTELAEATKEFDSEFVRATFGRPTPEARAQLRRARRKARPTTMRSKRKSYYERFMAMTDAERDAEVAQYDKEFVPTQPLNAKDRALHRRARQRAAARRMRVVISMDRDLVRRTDALAKASGTSRSQLIARIVEGALTIRKPAP